MSTSGWTRRSKPACDGDAANEHADALIRAAVRGDSLDQLLDLGARSLLIALSGDRAGLWLFADRGRELTRGRVVEAERGPIPEQWKYLDISTGFLRGAMEGCDPLLMEFGSGEPISALGPLVGMRSAIWTPLRARNRTFGLTMVAYDRARVSPNLEVLRTRVSEIMLAVTHHLDARRTDLAAEEFRAQLRLSRAILCGVSADSILPQIARAARHHLHAEFVALSRGGMPPGSGDAWDGPDEWRTMLQQKPLREVWRRVFEDGREFDQGADMLARLADPAASFGHPSLGRLIAIPIEGRTRNAGVLMAGFSAPDDTVTDFAKLESYGLLAATALDREFAREEISSCKNSLRQTVEDSRECLALVDETGVIRATSPSARALLSVQSVPGERLLLDQFFAPATRDVVTRWRAGFSASNFTTSLGSKYFVTPVEALLNRGGLVRLDLRSVMDGICGGTPTWLIHMEDCGERQASCDTEGRLKSEIAVLMDSIESGVLLLDSAGNIRMLSDRFAAMLGFETRRLLELGTFDKLLDRLADRLSRPAETLVRWREQVGRGDEAGWDEFELNRPTRRILERFARPIFSPDGVRLGWLEVYRDITGQRIIQSKLLQTEKMAALGQLVSGIAHELNNPLTSIQGYAQLLLSRHSASDRAGDSRRILQEAERASRIVKNLLLFSRETKPERSAVQLNEVIERTLPLRSYELRLENIAVELILEPQLPPTLADAAQLQQVILNLIVNAEQAILQGRGEGSQEGRIIIRTRRLAGDRIGMEISDDGPGIPPEIVSRIFDPFFTTKPAGLGTGLGLSIVYGIVQAHGGEVTVENRPDRGATLALELPALSPAAFDGTQEIAAIASNAAMSARHLPSIRPAPRDSRILVVEDERTVAELIADVMSEEGYRVEVLLDSREALGRLERKHYGLIICDLKMPHLDGPGLYRALVRRGKLSEQKLLFVTGDTMSSRTTDFLKSSGLPYLAKPFLVDELKQAVRHAVAIDPDGEAIAAVRKPPDAVARAK